MRSTFDKTLTQGIWTPAAVLLLGSLSIGLLIWTDRINEKQRTDFVVNGALMNVQIHTSMFHLGLDEFIGGSPDVDIKSVWKEFEAAMSLTNSVLNGGEAEHGVMVEPLKNPGMRAQAEDIKASLAEMREVALERLKEPAESGIESDVNRRLEKVFGVVLTRAAGLERIIEAERLRNQKNARHLFFGILSVWTLIVIVAVLGLWSRELRRKMAAAALREAEQKLRNIVEHSTNLFYMHAADHVFTYMSPQSRHFFDCEPGEAIGHWTELITDNPVNRAAIEATQRAIDTGERQPPYMVECIGRKGRVIWVEVNESPIVEDGRTVAIVGSLTDITERRLAEEEIKRLNIDLAARAAELEAANRDLEAFNYTVAHDLRKPLTVVNGYCQALKEMCGVQLDAHCKAYLQEAYDGTLRMNRLIDALLNFSRLAHIEPQRELIDLSGMVQVVAAELESAEPGRRVAFRIAQGISVNGDPNLLHVALDNLLGNAWKFTATMEEAVIEFGVTETGGKPACFVRDNGVGFDMADADKIFLPFQRLPGAEEFRGHGIGLATVERIISRHGGKIWAEGAPEKGATFYFILANG